MFASIICSPKGKLRLVTIASWLRSPYKLMVGGIQTRGSVGLKLTILLFPFYHVIFC